MVDWRKLWDDIRPNLLWDLAKALFGGAFMTVIWSWIKAQADSPFTKQEATIVFAVLFIFIALGFTVYQVKLRRAKQQSVGTVTGNRGAYHNWIMAILGIIALSLLGWNLSLQQRVRHLEVQMIRYVLPRELTKEQIEAFGNYMRSHSQPHEVNIRYVLGDPEAQRYAEDFASAFKAGNWVSNMLPVNPVAITCRASPPGSSSPIACSSELQQMINNMVGVNIQQTGPNPPRTTLEEKLHPQPHLSQIVSDALRAAGVRGIGSGYSHTNDPLNTITVSIGSRARDKWGVLPSKFFQRRNADSHEITDDDF